MSETERDELVKWVKILAWLVGGVASMAAGVAVYTTTMQRDVSENAHALKVQIEEIRSNASKLAQIEIWKAQTEASRFTMQEHIAFASATAKERAEDKTRLSRVEDAITWIKERGVAQQDQLNRIEAKIDARRTP